MDWFSVDKNGLARILERRGKEFALFELISNAWDTSAKEVHVHFETVPGCAKATITVEDDDPDGFANLQHAFTLFADSNKKDKAEKRGRFNLGEKLVLAVCDQAVISSKTGTLVFDKNGRSRTKQCRESGSCFQGQLRMTRAEYEDALVAVRTLIPPKGVTTVINGRPLVERSPIAEFEAQLATEIADADGNLKRSIRKAVVRVYEPLPGEVPYLYELGIPVVETYDKWHVDVQQKIPLNMDRDNVPPAFLRDIRTLVVNSLYHKLEESDASQPWVRSASNDKNCSAEAIKTVMHLRFGERKVAYDPSDPEANKLAVSEGYVVVHGRMLNSTEWDNVKKASCILPAGKVTPSPKAFDPSGTPFKQLPKDKWTEDIERSVSYCKLVASKLLNKQIDVTVASDVEWCVRAAYGEGHLYLNVGRLGHHFFTKERVLDFTALLIHELGHEYSGDHLSKEYYEALCLLGAKLAKLALDEPETIGEFLQRK